MNFIQFIADNQYVLLFRSDATKTLCSVIYLFTNSEINGSTTIHLDGKMLKDNTKRIMNFIYIVFKVKTRSCFISETEMACLRKRGGG